MSGPIVTLSLALLAALVACGGKILDEAKGSAAPLDSRAPLPPAASSPGALPPGDKHSVANACEAICARKGECGALQSDCVETCSAQATAGPCATSGGAYVQCWADNLPDAGCVALPPRCESDYCAFTRCTGTTLADYCH